MNASEYLSLVLKVGSYREGAAIESLRAKIAELYSVNGDNPSVYLVDNARAAELLFLKSLKIPKGSNVIIQAFTCNAVPNPVLWLGLEPRYVDVDPSTLSFSIEDLKSKIDENTKVIILQHTFGIAGPLDEVLSLAKERGIYVLEDCAHALGSDYNGRPLGRFGDGAIISFGLEKILPTRVGGALVLNSSELTASADSEYQSLKPISAVNNFLWLINPILWRVLRMIGPLQTGAVKFLGSIGLLKLGTKPKERVAQQPNDTPRKLSNVLSKVVLAELADLKSNLQHRREISNFYRENLKTESISLLMRDRADIPFVRYPVIAKDLDAKTRVKSILADQGIHYDDWYNCVIYPGTINPAIYGYKNGQSPAAEDLSSRIINLPTGKNIDINYARMITNAINSKADTI